MKRALTAVGVTAALVVLVWFAIHAFIPQIHPEQAKPEGHFGEPCWACHIVSSGANIIDE
jgi:hypothetical protein